MISEVIIYEDNKVSVHSAKAKEVGSTFPSGFYEAYTNNGVITITKEEISELHTPYQSKDTNLIIEMVEQFFTKGIKENVEKLGFIHKLGVLLHGKQGCGKTSLMNFIAKSLQIKQNGIVFFCNSSNSLGSAISISKSIREVQDNPIIFIADEFERYAGESESEMKNLLDGKDSISNSLFLAATNYIESVPNTLKDRPSRFRIVQEIKGITDKKVMFSILSNISKKINPNLFSSKEIEESIKDIKSCTIDELKHICINKVTNSYLPKTYRKSTIGYKPVEKEEEKEEKMHPFSDIRLISFCTEKDSIKTNSESNI